MLALVFYYGYQRPLYDPKKCKTILVADDTTVYVTNKNFCDLKQYMKHEVEILIDWFTANKLTLNLGKTSLCYFNPLAKKQQMRIFKYL